MALMINDTSLFSERDELWIDDASIFSDNELLLSDDELVDSSQFLDFEYTLSDVDCDYDTPSPQPMTRHERVGNYPPFSVTPHRTYSPCNFLPMNRQWTESPDTISCDTSLESDYDDDSVGRRITDRMMQEEILQEYSIPKIAPSLLNDATVMEFQDKLEELLGDLRETQVALLAIEAGGGPRQRNVIDE